MTNLFIDLKYAKMLGGRLPNFKQTKNTVFSFSHSCERNNNGRMKSRGNFFIRNNELFFHCYNCSSSSRFSTFLKGEDPHLYSEYRIEIFSNSSGVKKQNLPIFGLSEDKSTLENHTITHTIDKDIILLKDLEKNNPVLNYVRNRKIPIEYYDRIGLINNFHKFASRYDEAWKESKKSHPRLVFIFYDESDKPFAYSCRAFGKEQPKYVNLIIDKSKPKIYGLWKLDKNKTIYVTEGQIDSLFIDNSIAVGSANYNHEYIKQNKNNIVLVPDNDWKRNKQVYDSLFKAVESGFKVSLFPDSIQWKDINDCIVKGDINKEQLLTIINSGITNGPEAKLQLNYRKKFDGKHF